MLKRLFLATFCAQNEYLFLAFFSVQILMRRRTTFLEKVFLAPFKNRVGIYPPTPPNLLFSFLYKTSSTFFSKHSAFSRQGRSQNLTQNFLQRPVLRNPRKTQKILVEITGAKPHAPFVKMLP